MKKMVKRALALGICVMLILSSVVFVSAASATFFSRPVGSHRCTGRGTVTDGMGQAAFNATALPGQPILPDEAYSCTVWVDAFNSAGELLGGRYDKGHTSLVVTYNANLGIIDNIHCTFNFNGESLGGYFLYK